MRPLITTPHAKSDVWREKRCKVICCRAWWMDSWLWYTSRDCLGLWFSLNQYDSKKSDDHYWPAEEQHVSTNSPAKEYPPKISIISMAESESSFPSLNHSYQAFTSYLCATYLVMSFSYNILAVAHIQATAPRTPFTGGFLGTGRLLCIIIHVHLYRIREVSEKRRLLGTVRLHHPPAYPPSFFLSITNEDSKILFVPWFKTNGKFTSQMAIKFDISKG